MRVGDVMARSAVTIFSDATVEEAAELMLRHQVRGLAVLNRLGFLVGVLTERDLLRRVELGTLRHCPRWLEFWLSANQLAKEFVQTHGRKIHEVMTSNPIVLGPETPLPEAVDLMEQHGIKRLPVVQHGRVIGMLSETDVVRALTRRLRSESLHPTSDVDLRNRILQKYAEVTWMANCEPKVHVRDGVVELHGVVKTDAMREALVVVAENEPGVKRVENFIDLAPLVPGPT